MEFGPLFPRISKFSCDVRLGLHELRDRVVVRPRPAVDLENVLAAAAPEIVEPGSTGNVGGDWAKTSG